MPAASIPPGDTLCRQSVYTVSHVYWMVASNHHSFSKPTMLQLSHVTKMSCISLTKYKAEKSEFVSNDPNLMSMLVQKIVAVQALRFQDSPKTHAQLFIKGKTIAYQHNSLIVCTGITTIYPKSAWGVEQRNHGTSRLGCSGNWTGHGMAPTKSRCPPIGKQSKIIDAFGKHHTTPSFSRNPLRTDCWLLLVSAKTKWYSLYKECLNTPTAPTSNYPLSNPTPTLSQTISLLSFLLSILPSQPLHPCPLTTPSPSYHHHTFLYT